jgi:dTDP-4-dehydrorhamnose 3,5-epimerase
MIFEKTPISGAFIIKPELIQDSRGFFARSWDKEIFENKGLNSKILQSNISFNKQKGTIRGMHYQISPYEEAKLIRCTRGSAFEVMVDLRRNSNSFKKWHGVYLNSNKYNMLYVPEGLALGFQTIENNTELFYQMSQIFVPDSARGFRYDEPEINISWPLDVSEISEKDLSYTVLDIN